MILGLQNKSQHDGTRSQVDEDKQELIGLKLGIKNWNFWTKKSSHKITPSTQQNEGF